MSQHALTNLNPDSNTKPDHKPCPNSSVTLTPTPTSLRGVRMAHGALSYTNGAAATDDGRVYAWGGNCWQVSQC